MKIVIPGNPISTNRLYRGRRFLTKEGEQIKDLYACEAYRQYKGKPLTGPVSVKVRVFLATKHRRDLDNILKALFDAMKGILWIDDAQVVSIQAEKLVKAGGPPWVEISVQKAH